MKAVGLLRRWELLVCVVDTGLIFSTSHHNQVYVAVLDKDM